MGRPGLTSAKQLAGKKAAFDYPGQDGEALVKLTVQHAGIPPGKVHSLSLPDSPNRAGGAASGRIDAAELEFVDYHRLAAHTKGLTILSRMTDFKPRAADRLGRPPELGRAAPGAAEGGRRRPARRLPVRVHPGRPQGVDREARTDVLTGDTPELAASTYDYYKSIAFWPRADEPMTQSSHDRVLRFWRSTGQLDGTLPFGKMWAPMLWQSAARGASKRRAAR